MSGHWLGAVWGQVWPNLLADVLWVPLAGWWARSRLARAAAEHAARVEAELRQHREQLHLYLGQRPGPG